MHRLFATAAERAGYSQWLARVIPVELPPAVDQSPVSEPAPWHPDYEDEHIRIAASTFDPGIYRGERFSPPPYAAFAQ